MYLRKSNRIKLAKIFLSVILLFFFTLIGCKDEKWADSNSFVSIDYPQNNSIVREGFLLAGKCAYPKKLSRIAIYFYNHDTETEYKFFCEDIKNNTEWYIPINSFSDGEWKLPDGKYSVKAIGEGLYKKTVVNKTIELEIDNTSPVFVSDMSKCGVFIHKNGIEIQGNISDVHKIKTLEFSAFIFKNDVLQTEPVVFPITEEKDFFEGNPIVIARYYSKTEIDDEHNLIIKNEMIRLRNNYILIYGEDADDENSPNKKFSFGLTITDSAKIFQKIGDAGIENGNKNITNTYPDSVFLINPHKNLKDAENCNIQTEELTEENLSNDESENLQIVNVNDDGNDKNEIQNDSDNTDTTIESEIEDINAVTKIQDENLRNIDAFVENDKSENLQIVNDDANDKNEIQNSIENTDTTIGPEIKDINAITTIQDENLRNIDAFVENNKSENLQIINDDANDINEIQNSSENTDMTIGPEIRDINAVTTIQDENLRNIDVFVENDKSEFSITQDEIEIAKSAGLSTKIGNKTQEELLKISKFYPHTEENTFYSPPLQSDDVSMSTTRKLKAFLITIVVIIFIVIFLFVINYIINNRKHFSPNRNLYYGVGKKIINKEINNSVGHTVGEFRDRYVNSSAITFRIYILGLMLLLIPNSITRDIAFIVFLLNLLRTIFNMLKLFIKALFSYGNDLKRNDFNIKKFIGEKFENKCPKFLQFLLHDFIGSVLNIILSSPLNLIKYLFPMYTKDCLIIIGTFLINVVCISILLKTLLVNAVEIDLTFSELLWYPIKHLFQTIFS